jgi:hypothetical protein
MQDATGALPSCKRKPLGGCDLDQIARLRGTERTYHGRRLSRRKPSAAGGTRASQRMVQGTCLHARRLTQNWPDECARRCQVEAAWPRLVRRVRLAPVRSQGLRSGMRRIGATCAAAQTQMRCTCITSQEHDQNGADRQKMGPSPQIGGLYIYPQTCARVSDGISSRIERPD